MIGNFFISFRITYFSEEIFMASAYDFNSDSCAGCIVEKCASCIEEPCAISERVCEVCTERKQDQEEFKEIVKKLEDCQQEKIKGDAGGLEENLVEDDPYLDDGYSNPGYDIY
ncbi:hypothetical protein C9439_06125 [archaeon SCG-AAA382B04]|nr:hypothetical protein C9439_06125 [archaeon SCG-AAA382B04]